MAPLQPKILDGKALSKTLLEKLALEVDQVRQTKRILPKLSVTLVGNNPASEVYVSHKTRVAQEIGILSELIRFDADILEDQLHAEIERLNQDDSVHAILIQLPLPKHLDTQKVLSWVDPAKDVDGFHPMNLGKLVTGQMPIALPCTPAGIMTLLKAYEVPLAGKHAVIAGRSTIVGKPMGLLLLQENATVTFCHRHTQDLRKMTRQADILVAAVGIPRLFTADHVSTGVTVIDVGINRVEGRLVGDVDFEAVAPKAAFITPVPGGVGPMTIATLMQNTLRLYQKA